MLTGCVDGKRLETSLLIPLPLHPSPITQIGKLSVRRREKRLV